MNISINARTQYLPYSSIARQVSRQEPSFEGAFQSNVSKGRGVFRASSSESTETASIENARKSREIRQLARQLEQAPQKKQNPYAGMSEDRVNGFMELTKASESGEEEEEKKPLNYNYKEVATKIQRAKNSVGAGQAVLAAKRKVLELKGKISAGNGDPEELQSALTHAKRMEMAARKKKHHLELEELAATVQKRDERLDKAEEAVSDMKDVVVREEEEKVSEKEDAIFEEREEMLQEVAEELEESRAQDSEEMLAELNEMISEFGEEELKELEEAMEMLESMEIIDPHMSPEELEDLKRKHRAAENKAIMKADMDYLKDVIKHQLNKAAQISAMGAGGKSGIGAGGTGFGGISVAGLGGVGLGGISGAAFGGMAGVAVSTPAISSSGGGSVDVTV